MSSIYYKQCNFVSELADNTSCLHRERNYIFHDQVPSSELASLSWLPEFYKSEITQPISMQEAEVCSVDGISFYGYLSTSQYIPA